MNYYIDIIDTLLDTHTTVFEKASAESIVLDYNGADSKDDLSIVGSSLSFNIGVEPSSTNDAALLHLFTGDETRYKVVIYRETDDLAIWQGFLLPDSYSEPYNNNWLFVEFVATDGLGRLKGKYLPDVYYEKEHSVIDIVSACLELTGLQFPVYVSLGVDNTSEKDWNNIYLDGLHFIKKDKKQDAYKILQSICEDTVSCLFQDLGKWYVTGLNKRNLENYTVKHYSYFGVYVEDIELTRNLKEIVSPLSSPTITMAAPYNIITVEHEREELSLPDTIATESNEGWAVVTGVEGEVYATDWVGNGGCYVKSNDPDYKNSIKSIGFQLSSPATDYAFDATKYVSLNDKLYLKQGQKVSFSFKYELELIPNFFVQSEIDAIWEAGHWLNPFKYEIIFNDEVILTNTEKELNFEGDKKAEIEFDYIANGAVILDLKFYQAEGKVQDHYIQEVILSEIKVEDVDFEDTYISTQTISDDYTIDKDITLTYADDSSGFSKAFLLAKIREPQGNYDAITVPILYGGTYGGQNYSVVQLDGANLIKDNINTTYYNGTLLTDLEVVYNYLSGEQMVVLTDTLYSSGSFAVKTYYINNFTGSRASWETWTDSVYSIESLRYADAVSNVYRRMFTIPHQKVDIDVMFPVSFNDILVWSYKEKSNYFVTNLSWNLDNGTTSLTMCKAVYQNDDTIQPGDNIPPIVDAGPDIYISSGATATTLTSTAYDPDGFIASYLWTKESGGVYGTMISPSNDSTIVAGLVDNEYEFKITVTDDDGATAFDTVNVIRTLDYNLILTLSDYYSGAGGYDYDYETFTVTTTPSMLTSSVVKLKGSYNLLADSGATFTNATARFQIKKNGVYILNETAVGNNITKGGVFEFLYQEGDVIEMTGFAEALITTSSAVVDYTIKNYEEIAGSFNVLNLPISKNVTYLNI